MSTIKSFISFLDGKKTAIGFACLVLASIIDVYFTGAGIDIPNWLGGIKSVLEYVGYTVGGTGVIHKATKGELTSTNSNK